MENSQFQNIDNHDIDSQHVNNLTPLGIQNPLFSSPPLGQSFLSTKFISPLGRQSLSNIDTLGLLRQENLDYNLPNQSIQTFTNSEVVEEEIPSVQASINSVEEIPAVQSFRNSEVVEEKAISPLPTTIENLVSTKPLGSSNLLIPEYNLLTSKLSYKPLQNIRTNIQTKREIQPSYSSENNLLINAKNNLINSEFIHNNTPFNIQKKSKNINQQSNEQLQQPINTTKIPESWSSLEELVGNNSNQVNTETSNIQMSSLPTQERENLINIDTEYYNNYYTNSNVSSGIESLVQMSRTASEEATNTNQTESSSNTSVKGDSEDNSKDADSKNFEILAREIYAFIRQRLEIERERGRNYY